MTTCAERRSRRAFLAGTASFLGGLAGCVQGRTVIKRKTCISGCKMTEAQERDMTTTGDKVDSGKSQESTSKAETEVNRSPADTIGVAHAAGGYSFTNRDYLNEGANVVQDLGANVLKIWLQSMAEKYPFNTAWSKTDIPVDIARTPQVKRVFNRNFDSYILVTASSLGDHNFYFRDGITEEQVEREITEFRELTQHLLREYHGTGKEFILQHWEGDWGILGSFEPSKTASERQFRAMRRWLDARQEGIRQARETTDSDVTVLGATEVNLVMDAMSGTPRVINEVVPETSCDLISLSAWHPLASVANRTDPRSISKKIRKILEFVADHASEPDQYAKSQLDGSSNVYIGELGWPLNRNGPTESMRIVRSVTETALRFGTRYIVYWQVFDNETIGKVNKRPSNEDVPGNHLVQPDGTKNPLWEYFARRVSIPGTVNDGWTPLKFQFDQTVPEYKLNGDIDSEDGRELTAAVTEILLEGSSEQMTYDVGYPGREPIVGKGVSFPESGNRENWRWLASPDAESTFYIWAPRITGLERMHIFGSPAKPEMNVTISIGGSESKHTLTSDGWLSGELTVSLSEFSS